MSTDFETASTTFLVDGRRRLNYWEKEYVLDKTKKPKSSFKPKGVFDFNELPIEIRSRIYDFVYVKPTNLGGPSSAVSRGFFKEADEWRCLEFATSCRQIYEESRDVFYAKNRFEFYYAVPALVFLMSIGARRRALLTKFIFHQNEFGNSFQVCRFFKSCTGLRELQVFARARDRSYNKVWWDYPVVNALEFFQGNPTKLVMGKAQPSGSEASSISDLAPPSFFATPPRPVARLAEHLLLVKREEYGQYNPSGYPNVFTDDIIIREKFVAPSALVKARFSEDFLDTDLSECEKYEHEIKQE